MILFEIQKMGGKRREKFQVCSVKLWFCSKVLLSQEILFLPELLISQWSEVCANKSNVKYFNKNLSLWLITRTHSVVVSLILLRDSRILYFILLCENVYGFSFNVNLFRSTLFLSFYLHIKFIKLVYDRTVSSASETTFKVCLAWSVNSNYYICIFFVEPVHVKYLQFVYYFIVKFKGEDKLICSWQFWNTA